jgi:membrane-associated phospholipid phosphatase
MRALPLLSVLFVTFPAVRVTAQTIQCTAAVSIERTAKCAEQTVAEVPPLRTAAPTQVGHPSLFGDLFAPLGGDFRRLASRETVFWLIAGGAGAIAVHPGDTSVTRSFVASHVTEETLDPGETIGNGAVQIGATLGVYVAGRLDGSTRVAQLGADLFRAQVVSGALTQGIKLAAGRTRPDGSSYSFPSGHASSAFATATVLQRFYGWKVGVPAFALAGYVGGSRLSENRHYLSDVIFGGAIGILSARAVTVGHGRHHFAVTPVATPDGVGVGMVYLGAR